MDLMFGPSLGISPFWQLENKVILVGRLDASRLCRDGEYEALNLLQALWDFRRLWPRPPWRMRRFAADARLSRFPLSSLDDRKVDELIESAIRLGDLVAIRKVDPAVLAARPVDPAVAKLRLIREIEAKTGGKMTESGRHYRLLRDIDFEKFPERNYYYVVRQDEAKQVLDALAKGTGTSGELAALFAKARDQITRDWRRPFSSPDGLILLRRAPVERAPAKDTGPAITPSQMKALLDAEKPVTFFARFVDEHGKGLSGFTGTLAHGSDPDSDLAFPGSGFAKVTLKGKAQAWLTLSDDATQDLVDALKARWKEIRGKVDKAWKAKEEALVEVSFEKGKLPELQLEAEKKHTFMLRPPVALARMHGMYFDANKCFLLPTAIASLKRLVQIYELHLDSELLIVGHTDTAGSEAFNLDLSADRAEAMRAYLRDDADTWLAWWNEGVRKSKRWGEHEDLQMIDALVPDDRFGDGSHVKAYQNWHNGEAPDARQEDQARGQPDGWEELKVDGILGPKTRRQLILDYMNLAGTSLEDDVRVVTYGCGEYFPLESEEGEVDQKAEDNEEVQFDRRVEVFFFAKPFGILPPVPGVADGVSSKTATKAAKGDKLYPEWRLRASRFHAVETEADGFRFRLCDSDLAPYANRPFALCLEDYPELRGTTDDGGFVIVDSPPAGAQGYVEVWPDDELPEETVRWELGIDAMISPATPLGASTRLFNLDYFAGEPSDEMTDELQDAISYFQGDTAGLEITGELDDDTCAGLRNLHECEPLAASPGSEEPTG